MRQVKCPKSTGVGSHISCGRADAKLHVNFHINGKATQSGTSGCVSLYLCSLSDSAQVHFGRALYQEANLPG